MTIDNTFSLTSHSLSNPYVCRSTFPVRAPDGHRVISSTVLTASTRVSASDRNLYKLPEKILAWRISSIENSHSELYIEVEFLYEVSAPDCDGISNATFKSLCCYGRDALDRIAPNVSKLAMSAYNAAKSLQKQTCLF